MLLLFAKGTSMPLKKPIDGGESTLHSAIAWTSTPDALTRTVLARVRKPVTWMDGSVVACVLLTGAIVVSLMLAGY